MSSIVIEDSTSTVEQEVKKPEVDDSLLELVEVRGQEVVLLNDSVVVKGVGGLSKPVSYEDFLSAISKATNTLSKDSKLSFLLPSGTFYLGVSPNSIDISCYYPESKKPFSYSTSSHRENFEIITPNIIVSNTLRKERDDWIVDGTRYMVTDRPISKLTTDRFLFGPDRTKGLYIMPFTNAYDSGTMCYGNNRMPGRFINNNLKGLDYYYSFLWDSPFNDDLGLRGKVVLPDSISGVRGWYHHLRDLAKKGEGFPYKLLNGYAP